MLWAPLLRANSSGGPLGRTGAFGEPGCDGTGCHRSEPLGEGGGRVIVDVGPYVPGQPQRIRITVFDSGARRWGFQLAARLASDPQQQAGSFEAVPNDLIVRVRCAGGTPAPCDNELQYVTQTSLGARENSPAPSLSYRAEWTPPLSDVGPVVFTVAAVGADGDRGTSGDHSYTNTMLSVYGPGNAPMLRENGAVHSANLLPTVTPGTLVSLFGEKLAPPGFSRAVISADIVEGQLPIELSRIGVDIFAPNSDPAPGFLSLVSEKQVDVQIPALPPGYSGPVDIQPVFNRGQGGGEIRGNKLSLNIVEVAPGIFTSDGKHALYAFDFLSRPGTPIGRSAISGKPRLPLAGDIIQVFGTGFGTTTPAVDPGSVATDATSLNNSVNIRIGDTYLAAGDMLYLGAAPGLAGIQQFKFRIPAGVGSGDLPLVITVRGLDSQAGVVLAVDQ